MDLPDWVRAQPDHFLRIMYLTHATQKEDDSVPRDRPESQVSGNTVLLVDDVGILTENDAPVGLMFANVIKGSFDDYLEAAMVESVHEA
jgi:hypothetical protein